MPGQDQNDFRLQTLRNTLGSGFAAVMLRPAIAAGSRAGVIHSRIPRRMNKRQPRPTLPRQCLAPQFFVAGNQCLAVGEVQSRGRNSATFFFPQQLSLDAARMNLNVEIRLHELRQLKRS